MALVKFVEKTKIQLRLENGLNEEGQMQYRTMAFNRIKETASDEAVQAVGAAIGGLQKRNVDKVLRIDEVSLMEQ